MKMSEEMAVRLHRMMWSDMQRELGNRPTGRERQKFKVNWISTQFPGESIAGDCWLCEYASSKANRGDGDPYCKHCPISWPNGHCNTLDYSYAKEPISDILALPARNPELQHVVDELNRVEKNDVTLVRAYYKHREELLAEASGIPAFSSIDYHVEKIKDKAYNCCRDNVIVPIAEASGLSKEYDVFSHIKAIQEKAVEEYYAKTPGAKLATMDVDQAFKQYADEQKAPIFKQLSNASGLSENNHAVLDHIILIKSKAKQEGRDETKQQMKDLLAEQSGLNHNIPIDDHIREIVKNSMEAGAAEERDRIQEKVYEVLLS